MVSKTLLNILLIEDNADDAELVQAALSNVKDNPYCIQWVTSLAEGLARLKSGPEHEPIDVVILDLMLSDSSLNCSLNSTLNTSLNSASNFVSRGENRANITAPNSDQSLAAFDQVVQAAPDSLILVLDNNEERAQQIFARGAHDFFTKNHIDSYWLPRALRYITEHKKHELVVCAAEKELFEERERSRITLNAIGDAVLSIDLSGNLIYINRAAEIMTGWPQNDALGRPIAEVFNIINSTTRKAVFNSTTSIIHENEIVTLEANPILLRSDGTECVIENSIKAIYNRDGKVTGAVIIFHNADDSRTTALKMTHLAQHDFLTGLPNRLLLTERLSQAIGLAYRNNMQVALLFIDLDFFKHINDSLGHAIGDQLLQSVAERLVSCVRATDTVCRQGGDEFVILLSEIERPQDAALTAEKLFVAFSEPHLIGVHELHITLSIGISVYPGDGKNAEALMQNADAAMYHAKIIGRNNFQFFKMEMNARAMQRSFIEASLRRAIKQQEFILHYQPKIDIASGIIVGAEALIRWQNPKLGLIYPAEFLSIAEECGLIIPIGGWVLREACQQLRTWLNAGLRIMPIAINISAAELKHKYFLDGISQVLRETGLPPYYLELEFTETILMRDAELSVTLLESLKAIGVQLTIDDFGTGYSSLSYLKRFPVGTLKIDSSFMRDLDMRDQARENDNATIVSAIIAMGKNLKQRVLAEGVETLEQFAFLRSHRCDEAQGLYLSSPMPAEDFSRLLVSNALPVLRNHQRTDFS